MCWSQRSEYVVVWFEGYLKKTIIPSAHVTSDSVRRISNRSLESDRFLLVVIGFMTMLGWADSVGLSVSIEKVGPAASS